MEKYMEIHKNCKLYEDYFKWLEGCKELLKAFDAVKEKYSIESDKFYPSKKDFRIVPTENDKKRFKTLFKKNDFGCFKKNADISKDWHSSVTDIENIEKPRLFYYFSLLGHKWRNRLFHVGEKLYCSIEVDAELEIPDFATEMKGSEFHKIMEELEEKGNL